MSPASDGQTAMTPASPVPLWRKAIPAAAVIVVGLAAGYGGWTLKPSAPRPVTRFAITLTEGDTFTLGRNWVALSPDGTRLAYTANNRLYLRARDQLDPNADRGRSNPGACKPEKPVFLTGRPVDWILGGGAAQEGVCQRGGAGHLMCCWRRRRSAPPGRRTTPSCSATAPRGSGECPGMAEPLSGSSRVDAGQRAHGPQLLPDGRTVLFTLAQSASWDEAQIVVQSLDGGTRKTVIAGGTDGRYLSTGHLVYALGETVLAVPFDTTSLSIRGGPVPMVEGVRRQTGATSAPAQFALSSEGTLAYVPPESAARALRTLVWVDRQGREEAIPAPPRSYRQPRISPRRNATRNGVSRRQAERGHLGLGRCRPNVDTGDVRSQLRRRARMDARRPTTPLHLIADRRAQSVLAGRERNGDSGTIDRAQQAKQRVARDIARRQARRSSRNGIGKFLHSDRRSRLRPRPPGPPDTRRGVEAAGENRVRGVQRRDLARRPMAGLPVEPFRYVRSVRATVSGCRERSLARFHGWRDRARVGPRRPGTLLSRPQRRCDACLDYAGIDLEGERAHAALSSAIVYARQPCRGRGSAPHVRRISRRPAIPDDEELRGADQTSTAPRIIVVQNWFEELKRLAPTN